MGLSLIKNIVIYGIYLIYDWSYNRGYINTFYLIFLTKGIKGLVELIHFFDRWVIDGITNEVGITSFFWEKV